MVEEIREDFVVGFSDFFYSTWGPEGAFLRSCGMALGEETFDYGVGVEEIG
jgi:hypothetical protein